MPDAAASRRQPRRWSRRSSPVSEQVAAMLLHGRAWHHRASSADNAHGMSQQRDDGQRVPPTALSTHVSEHRSLMPHIPRQDGGSRRRVRDIAVGFVVPARQRLLCQRGEVARTAQLPDALARPGGCAGCNLRAPNPNILRSSQVCNSAGSTDPALQISGGPRGRHRTARTGTLDEGVEPRLVEHAIQPRIKGIARRICGRSARRDPQDV